MATQTTKQNILLVEDDIFMVDLLSRELANAGYDITIAKTGREATEKFKERVPDLILLDLILPDQGGFDMLREIRRLPAGPETKVMILSNVAEGMNIEEAKRLGAIDYLIKANFTLPEILEKIRAGLAS